MRFFSGDYIDLSANPLDGETAWSYSYWQTDSIDGRRIFSNWTTLDGDIEAITQTAAAVASVFWNDSGVTRSVSSVTTPISGINDYVQIGAAVDGTGGTGALYIDGADDTASETIQVGMPAVSITALTIGARPNHANNAWGNKGS